VGEHTTKPAYFTKLNGLRAKIRRVVGEFFALLTRSSASGSRSTALQDARWLFVIALGALVVTVALKAPTPILWLLSILCAMSFVLACGSYLYLLRTNPDALRSERFTIEKMRIEKGIMGDTLSGFRDMTGSRDVPILPSTSTEGEKL
jgi:hypothetical protein